MLQTNVVYSRNNIDGVRQGSETNIFFTLSCFFNPFLKNRISRDFITPKSTQGQHTNYISVTN